MAVATSVGIGGGFLRTQADRFVLVLPVHVGWNGYRGSEVRGIEDGHTLCQMSVDAAKSAREYALFFYFSRIYVLCEFVGAGENCN